MAKKRSRLWFGLGVVAVLAVFLAFAFWPRALPVDLGVTATGPMIETVEEEARTRVAESYVITAPITGQLLRVELEPGDAVGAGQTVARISPPALDERSRAQASAAVGVAEAALQSARANEASARDALELARTELARIEPLRGTGAVAPADIDRAAAEADRAQAAMAAASASVRQAEANVSQARSALIGAGSASGAVAVTAPVSGVVLNIAQESATTLSAGQPILELGDVASGLEVVAELISTEALEVSVGDRVILSVPGSETVLDGVVTQIEPAGFTKISALGVEEQRVNVIMTLTGAAPGLGAGYRLDAKVVIWEDQAALTAPSSALFRDGAGWAVFRVEGGRARLTPVEVGRNNGTQAQILEGLETDTEVVLFPGPELADGSRVRQR